MYFMGPKPEGYVLAGIVNIGYVSVCIGFGLLSDSLFSMRVRVQMDNKAFNSWLTVTAL